MVDDGCPTCGSKKFGLSKLENDEDDNNQFLRCQNCKKIWTP